jgi:hypothetical protein
MRLQPQRDPSANATGPATTGVPLISLGGTPAAEDNDSSTTAMHASFLRLQALLASRLPCDHHAVHAALIKLPDVRCVEKLSLLMLTLPAIGRLDDAIEMLLSTLLLSKGKTPAVEPAIAADIIVSYARHTCRGVLDWEVVCTALLRKLGPNVLNVDPNSSASGSDAHAAPVTPEIARHYLTVYNLLLEHLVVSLSPEQFVSLLPANGSTRFFLPVSIAGVCLLFLILIRTFAFSID